MMIFKKLILLIGLTVPLRCFAQAEVHADGQSGVDSIFKSQSVVQITGETAAQLFQFLQVDPENSQVKTGKNILCRKNILGPVGVSGWRTLPE